MLKGDKKTAYQRVYMRKKRAGLLTKESEPPVTPPVRPVLVPIPGLIMDGNRIAGVDKSTTSSFVPSEKIPLYRPGVRYTPGSKVLVKQGDELVEVVAPEVDADGNVVY